MVSLHPRSRIGWERTVGVGYRNWPGGSGQFRFPAGPERGLQTGWPAPAPGREHEPRADSVVSHLNTEGCRRCRRQPSVILFVFLSLDEEIPNQSINLGDRVPTKEE